MAIKSELNYKGLVVPEAYSRIAEVRIASRGVAPKVELIFQDFSSTEAAEKVIEDVRRLDPQPYDPENEEHRRQWNANGGIDADGNEVPVDPNWAPTIYITEQKWLGKRAEEPLRERSLELPLELAMQLLARAVPGTPEGLSDRLVAEAYLTAMRTGEFVGAEAV